MTAGTFVGANAGVSGNNASLSPTIHSSAAAGDLMLLFATIRNTAGAVVTPSGWLEAEGDINTALFYKFHSGSESAPTVTFTGGSAGDDTLAQIAVFRGFVPSLDQLDASVSNASAQNIAIPATATPSRDGSLVIVFGYKQDDWTSVATLTSMTEIGETTSTAGSDAGQVWDYWIQTTAAGTPAGPFTVTGGASATSKALFTSFDQAAAIAVTQQDSFPPRNLVSVTNLIVGDSVAIYREVGGERTLLRAGSDDSVDDTSFLRVDAELPFGVPVTYVASVNGYEYTAGPTTYSLPGSKVALSDAISGASAEVVILAWPEKDYARPSTVFQVAGRNIVDLGDVAQFTGPATFFTETQSARENLESLLTTATEGVVQVRTADSLTYDDVDCYVAVTGYRKRRFSQDGSDKRRTFDVDLAEVDGWATDLEAGGFTLQDIADFYGVDGILTDIDSDFTSLLDIALADFST